MNELDAWIAAACAELGLQPDEVKAQPILDVARDVAHQVIRPGAPVSAYLMGVAVGRGADPSDVAARLSTLALAWPSREAAADNTGPDSSRRDSGSSGSNSRERDAQQTDSAGRDSASPGNSGRESDAQQTDSAAKKPGETGDQPIP